MNLKNKVEAILFAIGKRISAEDIAQLCRASSAEVDAALKELAAEYASRDSSVRIFSVNNVWKIDVKDEYLDLVRNIVVQTDLPRPTMETLSLIAYKKGALQSDIIKQRGVGAYDHIRELLDLGFIAREKEGRSYRLRLAQRFFDYFAVGEDGVAEVFADFHTDEAALAQSEEELKRAAEEQKKEEGQVKKVAAEREERGQKHFAERMQEIDTEVENLE